MFFCVGGSCDGALLEAAVGWGIAGVKPEVEMEALEHPGTEEALAGQWGVDDVQGEDGWPGLSEEPDWHVLEETQPGEHPGERFGRR